TTLFRSVPFKGDSTVFDLRPSTFNYGPPRGRVVGDELVYTIEYPYDAPAHIDGLVNGFVESVQSWLGWASADIGSFNAAVEQTARGAIEARRTRIDQRDAHLAKSSIPVGKPSGKTYIAEAIVRRPAPRLPKAPSGSGVQLEPVLEDE